MIKLYDPRSRQSIPATFFHHIETRRYEWLEAQCRAAGAEAAADMCRRWAEDHRLTVEKLAEVDRRVAELDARLRGDAA